MRARLRTDTTDFPRDLPISLISGETDAWYIAYGSDHLRVL